MTFSKLSPFSAGMVLVVFFIILITFIYNMVRSMILKRNRLSTCVSVVAVIVTFIIFEILEMHFLGDFLIGFELPIIMLLLIQMALFILAVTQQYAIGKWERSHISNMSVKEAFDRLPTGLCYYFDDGVPVMVNDAMQCISREMFGKSVTDAELLWENLSKSETSKLVQEGDIPIVKSTDGRAFSIKRNLLRIHGRTLPEIIAVDVSTEYRMTRELESRQAKARRLNSRLKALLGTIEYVTMNRELLSLKTALHDNIGQSILIAKRYLLEPESVDKKEMLKFWRNNIKHLLSNEVEEWEFPYYVISRQADKLGIKLQITGELPGESRLIPVVDSAISVHIGNVLKHAGGNECRINVEKTAGSYILNFLNDGKKPDNVIIERGGLKNLRRDVENIGGRLNIYTSPEFRMEIILPVEDSNSVIWGGVS